MKTRKVILVVLALALCLTVAAASADKSIPNNHQRTQYNTSDSAGVSVQLIEDMATRSGPSTEYTGCGTYRINGQFVTALSRAYDNGGVLWIEVAFSYGGGYRRAWTGAKRLDISPRQLAMLPEESLSDYIGYGTVTETTAPRFGPGSLYATYSDRNFYSGDQVVIIRYQNGYCLVECYHTDGKILRCWLPESVVQAKSTNG